MKIEIQASGTDRISISAALDKLSTKIMTQDKKIWASAVILGDDDLCHAQASAVVVQEEKETP
jgi:hypothetical protein